MRCGAEVHRFRVASRGSRQACRIDQLCDRQLVAMAQLSPNCETSDDLPNRRGARAPDLDRAFSMDETRLLSRRGCALRQGTERDGQLIAILVLKDVSKAFGGMPCCSTSTWSPARFDRLAARRIGSGKTTLLQIIAGLQDQTAASSAIDGRICRACGVCAACQYDVQSYALFPHLTCAQCRIWPESTGRRPTRAQQLVAWALQLARIEEFAGRRPDQLSGGQRQRVALARCLS